MYHMSLHTLAALEEHHRRQFCKTSLEDLKEDGFKTDPDSEEQLEALIQISKRIEAHGFSSDNLQYRYFMLYTLLGNDFLQDQALHNRLVSLQTEERSDMLEQLINKNLQGNT